MQNLLGKKYARLTIIDFIRDSNNKPYWKCKCICGKEILTTTTRLNAGYKKSCGCLNTELRKIHVRQMGSKNKQNTKKRFFKYVKKEKNGCWNWVGDIGVGGYGRFWYKGTTVKAHRLSYEKYIKKIPTGLLVCHTCDNPKCVNPNHLFLGTAKTNSEDMVKKGRQAKGEKSGRSKLNQNQVNEILKIQNKYSISKIAKLYNVHYTTIYHILRKTTWK